MPFRFKMYQTVYYSVEIEKLNPRPFLFANIALTWAKNCDKKYDRCPVAQFGLLSIYLGFIRRKYRCEEKISLTDHSTMISRLASFLQYHLIFK